MSEKGQLQKSYLLASRLLLQSHKVILCDVSKMALLSHILYLCTQAIKTPNDRPDVETA